MTMLLCRCAFVAAGLTGLAVPALAQDLFPPLPPLGPLPPLVSLEARAQGGRDGQPDSPEDRARRAEAARQRAEAAQRRAAARRGPEYTEAFSRTLALGRPGSFELANPFGDIVVTGGRGNELRIDATKRVQHPDETQGRALLQAIEIQISERSGLIDVRTVFPRSRGWAGSVDYTIALPDSASVLIRTVSGNVRLTNIQGDLRANTVSGSIIASDLGRVRSLRSVSGSVQISDAQSPDLVAGTVSGDLTVTDLRAESATLESVSGEIRLSDVELERVRLRSMSGDIQYQGRLQRGGRYEMESHSGDVLVTLPRDAGFDLEASTFSGGLRSDFELRTNRSPDTGGRGRTRAIQGTVGDAGALMTLRTFSGDVTLTRPQ